MHDTGTVIGTQFLTVIGVSVMSGALAVASGWTSWVVVAYDYKGDVMTTLEVCVRAWGGAAEILARRAMVAALDTMALLSEETGIEAEETTLWTMDGF